MININLSSLIQRLHPIAKVALEDAAALAVSEKANEVQIEPYLLSLLERPNSDFDALLSHALAMNIAGATAVIYAELGFPPPLARGLFLLSR